MDKIDKVFYINLEKRIDRRVEIEDELVNNFKYTRAERFVGILYKPGCYGCIMSHICLLRKMIVNNWDTMMVFEDDVKLLTDRANIDLHINMFLNDDQLDILCIGNSCGDNKPYNELMNRCFNTQTTSCYIIKKKFVKSLLECLFIDNAESMTYPEDSNDLYLHTKQYIDVAWFPLQKIHYFMMPKIRQVLQRPSYSDIVEKFTDYKL
jgi:GR25 family glycosyltransferase involved in LPS biosynthesis